MNLAALGGRRFLLCIGSGLGTTFLQFMGKLDPAGMAYTAVIAATIGAFITGNVFENKHNVQAKKDTL